jgi:hypothetical protein
MPTTYQRNERIALRIISAINLTSCVMLQHTIVMRGSSFAFVVYDSRLHDMSKKADRRTSALGRGLPASRPMGVQNVTRPSNQFLQLPSSKCTYAEKETAAK